MPPETKVAFSCVCSLLANSTHLLRGSAHPVTTATTSPSTQLPELSEQIEGVLPDSRQRRSRRRRRESSPELPENLQAWRGNTALNEERSEQSNGEGSLDHTPLHGEEHLPSSKRIRFSENNMHPDGPSTTNGNGLAPVANGTSSSPLRKSIITGSARGRSPSSNAHSSACSNGSSPAYFGHNREEVTRILIQSLYDLGYNESASTLSNESRYELETSGVASFRSAVLDGRWAEAESLLLNSSRPGNAMHTTDKFSGSNPAKSEGLILSENANENEMLFCLRQQKFLEMLERRNLPAALMILRQELTPLNHDTAQLHALSRLVLLRFLATHRIIEKLVH